MMINTIIPVIQANQKAYLLLNLFEDPKQGTTLKKIYKNGNHPQKIEWLYDTTLLREVKEQGPLLIEVTHSPLLEAFKNAPEQWTGYLIYTHQPTQKLLEHLRNILTVRFYKEEKGLLNYMDPKVADFFFRMPKEQLGQWLGTIDTLCWWGADFIATANGQQTIHCIENPLPTTERIALKPEPYLTVEQEKLLEQCQEQQSVWEWSLDNHIPLKQAWQYYQEARQLNFNNKDIEDYMHLRSSHAMQNLLNVFPEHASAQQKLQILQDYWNKQTV